MDMVILVKVKRWEIWRLTVNEEDAPAAPCHVALNHRLTGQRTISLGEDFVMEIAGTAMAMTVDR